MKLPHELDAGRLLMALREAGVEFVVIGGFAVSAHGYPRGTKDLDIVPNPDAGNLDRLAKLLENLGAEMLGAEDFEPDELIEPDTEGLRSGGNFVLGTKLGRLDIMQSVGPDLDFQMLEADAVEDQVFGQPVRFCGYEHLVEMKRSAGRPEDLIDLERLREAREGP
ncbi:MAG: hypothetical protein IPK93_03475 [Solirubrobacterales bacterium]|nr:hypothetical protein [Solirubrobacterales bacterium]